jgi:hypothetical protein
MGNPEEGGLEKGYFKRVIWELEKKCLGTEFIYHGKENNAYKVGISFYTRKPCNCETER